MQDEERNDHSEEDLSNKKVPSPLSYHSIHSDESCESLYYLDESKEISNNSRTIFMFGGSDDEFIELTTEATKDKSSNEDSSDVVYLEYESENEGVNSELEKSNNLMETCSIPESVYPDPNELKFFVEHLKKNTKYPHCNICNIGFRTSEQLNEHCTVHDSHKIVTCEVCKNIVLKDLYKVHLKAHREIYKQRLAKKYKKLECTVCGKTVSKTYMKFHLLQHGTSEDKAKRMTKCTICNTTISAPYLSVHIKLMHEKQDNTKLEKDKLVKSNLKIKCPICSRFLREDTYMKHVESHASSSKIYVCEECGREFSSPSSLKTHSLTHKEVYKYKCHFCPYQGKHLGLLKVHVRTHTKDYLYQCPTCDSKFLTKSNLSAHQKTHDPKPMFMCSECGKFFLSLKSLQSHTVAVHEGIRAYVCNVCGKGYASKIVLASHKKHVHNISGPSRIGRIPSYLLAKEKKIEIVEDCLDTNFINS